MQLQMPNSGFQLPAEVGTSMVTDIANNDQAVAADHHLKTMPTQ